MTNYSLVILLFFITSQFIQVVHPYLHPLRTRMLFTDRIIMYPVLLCKILISWIWPGSYVIVIWHAIDDACEVAL